VSGVNRSTRKIIKDGSCDAEEASQHHHTKQNRHYEGARISSGWQEGVDGSPNANHIGTN
jgi:hypothetical protein